MTPAPAQVTTSAFIRSYDTHYFCPHCRHYIPKDDALTRPSGGPVCPICRNFRRLLRTRARNSEFKTYPGAV